MRTFALLRSLAGLARVEAATAGCAFLALLVAACAPRPVTGAAPDVEGLDKFGAYRARRMVVAPVEEARLSPGDTRGQLPAVVTLGRARDAGAMLLLRFAVDLPPGVAVMGAYVLLDRVPTAGSDDAEVALHTARIAEPWTLGSLSWGRAPRIEAARSPGRLVGGSRGTVRLDVRALVERWARHDPGDQGIAVLADRVTPTGVAFALEDGVGDDAPDVPSVRSPGPPALYTVAAYTDPAHESHGAPPRGPRLELYVRP
jgi:hypothetical protein